MKNKVLLFVLTLIFASACNEDDTLNTDSQPEFTNLEETVSSLPGNVFAMKASISDPAGIESVNLKYEPWFLDKTIVKDALPSTYNLDYSFQVPEDAEKNSQHVITITSTNAGGKSTSRDITVTLDLDIEKPDVKVNNPLNGATILISNGIEIALDVNVSDNKELAEFSIEGTLLSEVIEISGTSYHYQNNLDVTETGTYSFAITATDISGNQTTEVISVNVLDELKFETMYLTDVSTSAELRTDVFGVPVPAEASTIVEEAGYVFTARYYAETPNAEVRFIPQKESFVPYAFGADPDATGALLYGDSPEVNPIVLPEIGYYTISLDLRDLTYNVTPYQPADATFPLVQIIGTGVEIAGESTCTSNVDGSIVCWNFASGKALTVDPDNPYRFSATVRLFNEPNHDGSNGFILNANTSGWNPFWRFDNGESPNSAVLNGGTNFVFGPESYGTFKFVFDTHLNQVSMKPVN